MNIILASSLAVVRAIAHQHGMVERLVNHEEINRELDHEPGPVDEPALARLRRVLDRGGEVTIYALLSIETLKQIHESGWAGITDIHKRNFPFLGTTGTFLTQYYAIECLEPADHYVMLRDRIGVTGTPLPFTEDAKPVKADSFRSVLIANAKKRDLSPEALIQLGEVYGLNPRALQINWCDHLQALLKRVNDAEFVSAFKLELGCLVTKSIGDFAYCKNIDLAYSRVINNPQYRLAEMD